MGELSAECSREGRGGEAGGGGGIGRRFLLLLLCFSFFGRWQEPSATRSAFNYRWRMMLALFLSVMSCTCKLQNILESHHCPLIPPSPPPAVSPSLYPLRAKWFIFIAVKGKMATGSFPVFLSLTPSFKCWWFSGQWSKEELRDFWMCIRGKGRHGCCRWAFSFLLMAISGDVLWVTHLFWALKDWGKPVCLLAGSLQCSTPLRHNWYRSNKDNIIN